MATKAEKTKATFTEQVDICIGKAATPAGTLTYSKAGAREFSAFAYVDSWLSRSEQFQISPDLPLIEGHQFRRPPNKNGSVFAFAIADTEPDAWGRRVIQRAHAKERKSQAPGEGGGLNAFDYLAAVDDFSRMGAIRLKESFGAFIGTVNEGKLTTPPLIELGKLYEASRAVEQGKETIEDLKYLRGRGTSLGGMRPKCTILDEDGTLAIGKFPSVQDTRNVACAEVLALKLAKAAGITVAGARSVWVEQTPIAVITRFDRVSGHGRIPYLSASSLLQAERDDGRTYTELVDEMRRVCENPSQDTNELWRRLVFNFLITNVDDHLHNLGFLYAGNGRWLLAPAFDLNPFPDKDRESKTWLSEDTGPIASLATLRSKAAYFGLSSEDAEAVISQVRVAIAQWREVAVTDEVGLTTKELDDFSPAFADES